MNRKYTWKTNTVSLSQTQNNHRLNEQCHYQQMRSMNKASVRRFTSHTCFDTTLRYILIFFVLLCLHQRAVHFYHRWISAKQDQCEKIYRWSNHGSSTQNWYAQKTCANPTLIVNYTHWLSVNLEIPHKKVIRNCPTFVFLLKLKVGQSCHWPIALAWQRCKNKSLKRS